MRLISCLALAALCALLGSISARADIHCSATTGSQTLAIPKTQSTPPTIGLTFYDLEIDGLKFQVIEYGPHGPPTAQIVASIGGPTGVRAAFPMVGGSVATARASIVCD